MIKLYEKYKKLNIDYASIGLEMSEEESTYFCTPKGAKIIGWLGSDGVHFCFVKGFGETVFAVTPMSPWNDDHVNPVANSFEDFLKLLLACGDTSVIEQAHFLSKKQFKKLLSENRRYNYYEEILCVIEKELKIQPMPEPYEYIRAIQKNFDYSKIKYSMEYCLWAPPREDYSDWKVYFGEYFYSKNRSRPGEEIAIGKSFEWGEKWCVPAVYICAKGIVADICVRIEKEKIQSFIKKWNLSSESCGESYSEEERQIMENEHPLNIAENTEMVVNGKRLIKESGCTAVWNPCLPEDCANDRCAQAVLEHYGCDAESGWVFIRGSFPWATVRKPQIKTVSIVLDGKKISIPAGRPNLQKTGDKDRIIHPITGSEYELTAIELTDDEMNINNPVEICGEEQEFPTCYKRMLYIVSPQPEDELVISDTQRSDLPRTRKKALYLPQATNCAIAIIGGADGPTAITGGVEKGSVQAACSAMHFEKVETVDWKAAFRVKLRQKICVELIPKAQ